MLKVNFKLDPASEAYLNSLPEKFSKGLSKALIDAMLFAEGRSKAIFKEGGPVLSPPGPLVARTGHLRRSITSGAEGSVGWVGTAVRYGKVHELTGAGKAKVLRPFLGPSFSGKNLDKIGDILVKGIMQEME